MIKVEILTPDEWQLLAHDAHLTVFSESRDHSGDNISYALLAKEGEELTGYLTAREVDRETVYWQFGGAFPGTRGTTRTVRTYEALVNWTRERYKRIVTFVLNTNIAYLRLAMASGFLISGIKYYEKTVLVELSLDFRGGI